MEKAGISFFDSRPVPAQERVTNLKRRYNVIVEDVPSSLRSDVFGDTFRPVKKVKTGVRTVRVKYAVFAWAKRVTDEEDFRGQLARIGPLISDEDLLTAVYDYHERYPTKTGNDFIRHAELLAAVLAVDAAVEAISEFVGIRCSWGRAYCKVLPQFIKFVPDPDGLLDHELRELNLDPAAVRAVPGVRKRLNRYVTVFNSYVPHPDFTPRETANRIAHFLTTRTNREQRFAELQAKFQEYSVEYREDSKFTQAYLNAIEDVDAEEVAAVMALTSAQFDYSHICFSQNHTHVESKLRSTYLAGRTWREALEVAERSIVPVYPPEDRYDSDDYDDYGDDYYHHRRW